MCCGENCWHDHYCVCFCSYGPGYSYGLLCSSRYVPPRSGKHDTLTPVAHTCRQVLWVCFLALYGLSRILQVSTEFYTVEGALHPDPDYLVHGYITPQGDYRGGSWSFGQILPVFLLIVPVVGFLRSISPRESALQPTSHSETSPVGIGPYSVYQSTSARKY